MIDPGTLPLIEVEELVYRVILSRYPQINLFERVSSPEQWDVLYQVESLTNPRLRDEVGDIRLVAPEDRVYGHGSSWIMASFTHPPVDGRGGRFNKDFGIYYCSDEEAVATAESAFHRARFLTESRITKATLEMRVIRAKLGPAQIHDLKDLTGQDIYDKDDYSASQRLGQSLREMKSFGVQYCSVRAKGTCYGVMRPKALSDAIHLRYLRYHFDQGELVDIENTSDV